MNFKSSSYSDKIRVLKKWTKPFLILGAIGFSLWFFYSVYAERNDGNTTVRIGNSAESSKQLRTEVRSWFRKTFPKSAARASEKYGMFEFHGTNEIETQSKWVFLAHGLDEPGNLWANLAPAIAEEGYRVFEFRYPNDQPVHESSQFFMQQLKDLLDSTEENSKPEEINLVGHSMGGLVLRNFITHPQLLPAYSMSPDISIEHFIQLGTPNHGSWLATYRLPVELRDHLFKDFGFDAVLGMIWDGAGEAQIDIKPESEFLESLNSRVFPSSIYWVGVAGVGSPVDLSRLQKSSFWKTGKIAESAGELNETFPELFRGTGDGCVSVDSLRCPDMNEVHLVDATHRNMVRRPGGKIPPAIPIVLDVLNDR